MNLDQVLTMIQHGATAQIAYLAALECGLLAALQDEDPDSSVYLKDRGKYLDASQIAIRCNLSDSGLTVLLESLFELALLERSDANLFRPTKEFRSFIQSAYSDDFNRTLNFRHRVAGPGEREFSKSLQSKMNDGLASYPGSSENFYSRLNDSPIHRQHFRSYMENFSSKVNPWIANAIASYAEPGWHFADICGGSQDLLAHLKILIPNLNTTLVDLPNTLDSKLEAHLNHNSINFIGIDVTKTDLPTSQFNCVSLNHLMGVFSANDLRSVLKNCWQAVKTSGGLTIFSSFMNAGNSIGGGLNSIYFYSCVGPENRLLREEELVDICSSCGWFHIETIELDPELPQKMLVFTKK